MFMAAAGGALDHGLLPGAPHLAEDLALAEDGGVEAGDHGEEVGHAAASWNV
jgi:hypothetical protein